MKSFEEMVREHNDKLIDKFNKIYNKAINHYDYINPKPSSYTFTWNK